MANLVYKRVSTDQQSTARQNLVLDEAGIEDPVVFEEDPGTSSRLHPLQRPKFRELLNYARPGEDGGSELWLTDISSRRRWPPVFPARPPGPPLQPGRDRSRG